MRFGLAKRRELLDERRATYVRTEYLSQSRVILVYELPLAELITDFHDRLKSVSRGYASFDYEPHEYRSSDMVKIEILLHGEAVDALSFITHKERAYFRGRQMAEKMKELIAAFDELTAHFKANDNKAAAELITKIGTMQKEGHRDYKRPE